MVSLITHKGLGISDHLRTLYPGDQALRTTGWCFLTCRPGLCEKWAPPYGVAREAQQLTAAREDTNQGSQPPFLPPSLQEILVLPLFSKLFPLLSLGEVYLRRLEIISDRASGFLCLLVVRFC